MVEGRRSEAPAGISLGLKNRLRRSAISNGGRKLRTVGIFAGIGGIELGLSKAAHTPLLLCELDDGARAVLDAKFPKVPKHDDVRTLRSLPPQADVLTAGFPCQDLSQAGRTAGISGSNSGLVGHVFRLLDRHPVPWVLLENVPFMLRLGGGHALEVIVSELERLGYRWAYRVVDTRAFGLPQRRERVFLLASLREDPRAVLLADEAGMPPEPPITTKTAFGFYWTEGNKGKGWTVDAIPTLKGGSTVGVPSSPAVWLPGGDIVTPDITGAEQLQGFESGWTEAAGEVTRSSFRWKLVGNAVSVPVAKWIGRRLASPGTPVAMVARPLQRGEPWPRVGWNVGGGRFQADLSAWPVRTRMIPLARFLKDSRPLSSKAAAGFLARAERAEALGKLKFYPGFLAALAEHINNGVSPIEK